MAQAGALPLKFREILNLTRIGVAPENIKFTNVTLSSEKFVVVREDSRILIVNLETKQQNPLPVNVESAIMNPVSNVLGLRAQGTNLQIYNLEMKSRMKVTAMSEAVVFWKWLDPKTIGIVTGSAVYHWSMDGDSAPVKQFDRQADPQGRQVQIINYDASPDKKWLLLQGITKGATGIDGVLQLYSVEHRQFQAPMNAHGGTFSQVKLDGKTTDSTIFSFCRKMDDGTTKLQVVEVGGDRSNAHKLQSDFPSAVAQDFPVSSIGDPKHGMLYILTQAGYLYMYELHTGVLIFSKQISQTTFFVSCSQESTGGVIAIDRNGRICQFETNEDQLVNYINTTLGNPSLGLRTAHRYNLAGAGDVFKNKFEQLLGAGQYSEAAKLAAEAPKGSLRTQETIDRFRALPNTGGTPPDLQYFQLLLQKGPLNESESVALCERVLQLNAQTGKGHIEKWIQGEKLAYSERLGDLIVNHDLKLACSVYYRGKVPEKTIICFLRMGHVNKVVEYAKSENYNPNYPDLLTKLHMTKPEEAKNFATNLSQMNLIDVDTVMNIFMGRNDVQNTTSFLLDYLKNRGDREEDAALQTKLLEINLRANPPVANAILESDDYKLSHYDRSYIARMCEGAQLYQRALEHYEDLEDIKRVLQMGIGTQGLNPEFLMNWFGTLVPEDSLSCLRDLMQYQQQGTNLQLCVEVAKRYNDTLTAEKLIALFEEFDCFQGLYLYLGASVNYTQDPEVVFKYIQAAAEINQVQQIELVCRENDVYDADQIKAFLLESNKVKDPRPLIHVCDRHGFVPELTAHLYTNQMYKFIEVYVQKMNPGACPKVVGSLLDLNAPEDTIRTLVNSVRPPMCPVDALVDEVGKRQRLRLLLPWLEARMHEGLQDVPLHNALAKIYVDINNNPQQFLMTNKFYDSADVGKYCESRDPHLAFLAYKRAEGACDEQLIAVCNKHGFYKQLSIYCVTRQDQDLWEKVLGQEEDEENSHRRSLIDQVVSTALPQTRNPDDVSATVKAFMNAELPNELIELLERIVLSPTSDRVFHDNKNLQNLLILTAIKADTQRVRGYIDRLDNYDGPQIAKIAISEQHELYEEGFLIYKKFEKFVEAINVLLNNIGDLERAVEFAEYCDKQETWGLLGKAQLDQGQVTECISSFLKAEDAQYFQGVIDAARGADAWEDLIKFLKMARLKVRDKAIDNELVFSFAKVNDLASLEEFISVPNYAKLDEVGDRCFEQNIFRAAKILFSNINNYAKLATTLVRLEEYAEAVEAARKANNIDTWKSVCYACVDAREFRLAQMCGVNIIVFMDHLQELIRHYEVGGHFVEIIQLLEQGINLDRAHQGIYTQLGILYAKYKEPKLMEHINLFWSRLNIPTLLQCCRENRHWKEAVFLYTHYEQYDNAAELLMEHSAVCWDHDQFKRVIVQVSNTEVYYRAINFYLNEHPLKLSEILIELASNNNVKLNHSRVVQDLKGGFGRDNNLPLIQSYLLHVQPEDDKDVNEAVNSLYVEEEDFEALRSSIEEYQTFDHIQLARQLEGNELIEFRRIAAFLYKINKRFEASIELSKKDRLWQDAMETARDCGDEDLAENLLRYFVDTEDIPKSCFTACLHTCYELIRPDVVLELSWRSDLTQFAMPYMIQTFREFNTRVCTLEDKIKEQEQEKKDAADAEKAQKQAEIAAMAHNVGNGPLMITQGPANPYAQPQQQFGGGGGFGAPQQQQGFGQQQFGQTGGYGGGGFGGM